MKIFIDTENKDIEITSDASEDAAPILNVYFDVPKGITLDPIFRFGYNIFHQDKTPLANNSFPIGEDKFISTDQDYILLEQIHKVEPEKTYNILVWAIHGTDYFEKLLTFSTTDFGKPFASWVFNSEKYYWIAPEPHPTTGGTHLWNEESRSWVRLRLSPTNLENMVQ
jgi:hypothetical protein